MSIHPSLRGLLAIFAILALLGACSDDDVNAGDGAATETDGDTDGTGDDTPTTTEAERPSPEESEAQITDNTTRFFELLGAGDQEAAAPLMENGEDYIAEMLHCQDLTSGASIAMKEVTIDGETATMLYDILLNGEVALEDSGGSAVFVDGEWLVAANTFLSLYDAAKDGCTGPPPEEAG
ncbi:MAG: hypothetical protein U5K30_08520 [Acidimicrobiales bacterium]|nr:hypothetical protein [Acidimicrobiales bacterium]